MKKSDKSILLRALAALEHLHYCGACGEDSWSSCGSGGRQAEELLEELKQRYPTIECERCDATVRGGLPLGWSQCGRSQKVRGKLASWCPKCKARRSGASTLQR